jgi:hypothetical protein
LLITHEAICDEGDDPDILHHAKKQVAKNRGYREGFRGAQHDMARLGDGERAERRQIVVGTGVTRARARSPAFSERLLSNETPGHLTR